LYIYLSSMSSFDPGRVRGVEAALRCWNKRLRLLLHLASKLSAASDEPEWCLYPGSGVPDSVGLFCYSLIFVGVLSDVDLRSFLYQHEMRSGWFLDSTNFGGSASLLGNSLSGVGGLLVLVASDSLKLGDANQPGRSAFIGCVVFGMQLKTATQVYFLRQGGDRLQVGRSDRRRRGRPGGFYKNLDIFFLSFEGVLVKRAVITKIYQ